MSRNTATAIEALNKLETTLEHARRVIDQQNPTPAVDIITKITRETEELGKQLEKLGHKGEYMIKGKGREVEEE